MAAPAFKPGELERLHIFRGVEPRRVAPLLGECAVRGLEAGEVLIRAREPNRLLYLLLEGELSIRLGEPDGEPVASLQAGESVGEISLIDREPASAFVVAAVPSRVLVMEEGLMWRLAELSHTISMNLLHVLAGRLREGNSVIERDRLRLHEAQMQARVDALTGLHNRRWIDAMLPRLLDRCRRDGAPLALLMTDIDDFKRYNDTHGHVAGDCALEAVAARMRETLRPADTAARYGGEEFLVVLPGAGLDEGRRAGERLRLAVRAAPVRHLRGHTLPRVTLSVGVAEMAPGDSPAALIEASDAALYRAKNGGRDRVCA